MGEYEKVPEGTYDGTITKALIEPARHDPSVLNLVLHIKTDKGFVFPRVVLVDGPAPDSGRERFGRMTLNYALRDQGVKIEVEHNGEYVNAKILAPERGAAAAAQPAKVSDDVPF